MVSQINRLTRAHYSIIIIIIISLQFFIMYRLRISIAKDSNFRFFCRTIPKIRQIICLCSANSMSIMSVFVIENRNQHLVDIVKRNRDYLLLLLVVVSVIWCWCAIIPSLFEPIVWHAKYWILNTKSRKKNGKNLKIEFSFVIAASANDQTDIEWWCRDSK